MVERENDIQEARSALSQEKKQRDYENLDQEYKNKIKGLLEEKVKSDRAIAELKDKIEEKDQ